MLRDCQTGGENDRLGAGAYRRSHRCLRHSISAVGPKIPSTEAVKTARPVLSPADKRHHIGLVGCSGDLLPPSPPAEKATARQEASVRIATRAALQKNPVPRSLGRSG